MVKLKKGPSIHGTLQSAVVATINDPNYSFSLPQLSDWESVVSSSADEKQRLEFVGDAVMHLSVALYLYRLFPNAAPGLYTNIRSAVNANATFTHLMAKAGAYELPSQSHSTKAAADSFEVIVAALYLERGFADVCTWVQEQYAPLIAAARESYDKCLTTSDHKTPFLSTKRHRGPDPASTPLLKKIRLSSGRSSPLSALMAQRVINRMKSKGKVKLCLPSKKSKLPLEMRLHSCELRTPEPQRPPSLVIDLTMDSESADEEATPSNATQVSQCSFKPVALSQRWSPPLQCDTAPPSDQNSYKCTVFHWPPQQGSTASLVPSHASPESPSPSLSATPPGRATSIGPQATFEFFRRSGLSLPPQSDNMHVPSGSFGNPIVVEDSEIEN
ncbi:ribonuclease III [Imleria badia]|nr:ribonuclease III [Imleria badia]